MKIKLISLFSLCFLLSGFLSAQSLVELAKKEKERRESLKDKKGVVVTNEDLTRVKRRPALESNPATVTSKEEMTGGSATQFEVGKSIEPSSSRVMPVTVDQESLPLVPGGQTSDQKSLEEKYQRAKEYVELLALKLNALWQEFYSLDDMTPRDTIQQAIAETFLKLQKAQEEEEKARQELEKYLSRTRKENVPSIWIR